MKIKTVERGRVLLLLVLLVCTWSSSAAFEMGAPVIAELTWNPDAASAAAVKLVVVHVFDGSLSPGVVDIVNPLKDSPLSHAPNERLRGVWYLNKVAPDTWAASRMSGSGRRLADYFYPISSDASEYSNLRAGKDGVLQVLQTEAVRDDGAASAVVNLIRMLRFEDRSVVASVATMDRGQGNARAVLVRTALAMLVNQRDAPLQAAKIMASMPRSMDLVGLIWSLDQFCGSEVTGATEIGRLASTLDEPFGTERLLALLGRVHSAEAVKVLAPYLDSDRVELRRIALSGVMEWALGLESVPSQSRDERTLSKIAEAQRRGGLAGPAQNIDPQMLRWTRLEQNEEGTIISYWKTWLEENLPAR